MIKSTKFLCFNKLLTKNLVNHCSSMTLIYNPSDFLKKNSEISQDMQWNNLLSLNLKSCTSKTVTDLLHTLSYRFEDEIKIFDNSNYSIVNCEKLNAMFLYFVSKARLVKHEQMIPFLRSYDIFQPSVLNDKCWEIVGRIINNCLNIYSDSDLIEICYYLTRIKHIPSNVKELDIFWQRIIIQSPNWLRVIEQLDDISLIYLLHVCQNIKFDGNFTESIINTIKESEIIVYRVEDFSSAVLLIEVMEKYNIFDQEIIENSISLISEINAKSISSNDNLCSDFVNLLWNLGNFNVKMENFPQFLRKIDFGKLDKICKIIESKNNNKLFVKLNKCLYLLGKLFRGELSTAGVDPGKCHPFFESDIIDSFYTIEMVNDSDNFFDKYSMIEFDWINLPKSVKTFQLLNSQEKFANVIEMSAIENYRENLRDIRKILSQFLAVNPTEQYELVVEFNNVSFGIVPCENADFICSDFSDLFVGILAKKYNCRCFKVPIQELIELNADVRRNQFIEKYFSCHIK